MPEPTQQQTPEEMVTELETLRRTNAELLQKSRDRKAKVTELEATVTELQGKLSEARDSLRDVTINGPLKAMAESISFSPELWLEQFNKSHRLEMVKGQLTLQTADGKPVLKGDKQVPFERTALIDLLTSDSNPQAKIFKSIIIASRASGASAPPRSNRASTPVSEPKPQFGLR
jgi:hypothetical protein